MRFHDNKEKLEDDDLYYRLAGAVGPHGYVHREGAEWILALHEEHWKTLEQLEAARAETEGDRVASMKATLNMMHNHVQSLVTSVGLQSTALSDVLGDVPVARNLKALGVDLRVLRNKMHQLIKEA